MNTQMHNGFQKSKPGYRSFPSHVLHIFKKIFLENYIYRKT